MATEFSIGQMAKLFATSVKTLRYYADTGILPPARIDVHSGYRYYTIAQFERLNTIFYLKKLGLSLSEIKTHLAAPDRESLIKQLKHQQMTIAEQIAALQRVQQHLQTRIKALSTLSEFDRPYLETLPARPCLRLSVPIRSNQDLELALRQFDPQALADATLFSGGVGVIRAQSAINASDFESISAIFVLADRSGNANLPGGKFATLNFNGGHDHAAPAYQQLLKFIADHHLKVCGDAIERTLIDQDVSADPKDYCTQIQLPVLTLP
ncbi:MerR family transcriptional regulator [Lacticaseibacillus porcinae]|uniref:MerR family transcriptional regulator n=1 Tax=Lacticaseibacillus porcinae TaxID=1123687 RepID=UPI000F7A9F5A|nr:MerR family transcriptional regulator [Lacticaseibacillus porcinae]